MMKIRHLALLALTATSMSGMAQYAAHYDMALQNGKITEIVSNASYTVASQLPVCAIAGVDGEALRFDGYSNYVKAGLPVSTFSGDALTLSVVLAAESYPMMQVDVAETTPTYATICGNLDETGKKGFALELSSQGDLRLRMYVDYGGGYLVTVDGSEKLPRGVWNNVTMTFDKAGNAVTLYLNGTSIGSKKTNRCALLHSTTDFMIGKGATDVKSGPFLINTFCGAIDDIRISNEVLDFTLIDLPDYSQFPPDFNYPASRYEASLWRPQFHGIPSGSWTNETHGLIYSNGKYHVFFQKNPNGPYMSRLHWGHISSENLYDWTEEPIAIYPGESFDIKGCWSGCVYEDGGNVYALYTAVDNEKARIVQAKAQDSDLIKWGEKTVVIDGRPSGLSDDFRDPYFFTANGQKYIIVGTSKNGIGACTLHKYQNGSWSNDGAIFFQGGSIAQHGTFWEMPNVTPMGNGKYLFTCTPLGTSVGVRTLCWVGTIGTDGKFTPEGGVQYLEMGGISRDGYGLLSPSIYNDGDKTLLLGIVPDKLATERNYEMGWAHNYSLPREISLAADGSLIQKPYSGLAAMRKTEGMSGRQLELLGEFTVPNGTCGFHFLKAGSKQASLSYDPATGILTLDYTTLSRVSTDNGQWSAALPKKVAVGEKLTLHLFLDGSIVDIFVNNTWAFSVRLFPTDADAIAAEAFGADNATINGWVLEAAQGGQTALHAVSGLPADMPHAVYDLQGRRVNSPAKGLYIMNGKKYVCR